MEALIGVVAILAWLGGLLVVMMRGYFLPAARFEELRMEVAAERGWFDGIEALSRPDADADREEIGAFMLEIAEIRERRRIVVEDAWGRYPDFKAEVRRRHREHYVPRHAELSLYAGGAWSLAVVVIEPMRAALVPGDLDILVPVYVLVFPLWIAAGMIVLLERLKTARRRAARRR